jgi:putative hemolysin
LPSASDYFIWKGLRVEVVDMDRRRVDKVMVNRVETDRQKDKGTEGES